MTTYQNADALKTLSLGKATQYKSQYSPELLQGVPRSLNRNELQLGNSLPFLGEDVWYGYELSWLNDKGKPVVAVAEFRFPCTNLNLIESKSFKLYLNSFNQSKFSSWQEVTNHLIQDLSTVSAGSVEVSLFPVDACSALAISPLTAHCIDNEDVEIANYELSTDLLKSAPQSNEIVEEHLVSHLLKSNCLITNQPDWATIFISYKGAAIDHQALLKYLISFRQHNEFHEQCVERIFTDLQRYCHSLEQLTVFARYTRRGGLDINPFRSTHLTKAPCNRTLRQ
jgi:7-cyano-7-deazaguanine reductase